MALQPLDPGQGDRIPGNGVGFRRVTQAPTELHAVTHAQVQELAQEVFAPESVLRMVQQ